MKRPWIVRELPITGRICISVGLLCLVGSAIAFATAKDMAVPASLFRVGCTLWPTGMALYALDYCCRAIEQMSSESGRQERP